MNPSRIKSLYDWLRFGGNLLFNQRYVKTKYQVNYLPSFGENPNYVPSKRRFLVTTGLKIIVLYLIADLLTPEQMNEDMVQKTQVMFAVEKEWVLPLALPQLIERFVVTLVFWTMAFIYVTFMYDLFSFVAVSIGINRVED